MVSEMQTTYCILSLWQTVTITVKLFLTARLSTAQQLWCWMYSIHYLRTQLLQDQVQPNITSTLVLKTGVCPPWTWLACYWIYSARNVAAFSLWTQYMCWMTTLIMSIYSIYCAKICTRYWPTNVLLILLHSGTIFL